MIVVSNRDSILLLAEFGPNDHREDAPQFRGQRNNVMSLASKFGQSAWYIRNTSTPDESLRPKSTMERLTFSLSGSALGMDFEFSSCLQIMLACHC